MVIIIINSNGVNSQSNRSASLLNNLANSKNSMANGSIDVHTHHITMSRDLVMYQVKDSNNFVRFVVRLITFFIA
jgi:hypothetical protein